MNDENNLQDLKSFYKKIVMTNLNSRFKYRNVHQIPKLVKIQINRGLGGDAQNKSILNKSIEEFRLISGQKPIITSAKKSIASFKVRENMNLGVSVTLRGEKMYSFFQKLIHLVLPRIRDFRGLNPKGFDPNGNYNFGLREQLVFPEINYDSVDKARGLNISIVTTAKTREEGIALLQEFGFPLQTEKGV